MKPRKSNYEKSKYRKRGRKAFTPLAILPFFLSPFVLDYCCIAIFNKSKVAKFASYLLYTSFNGHSFNNLYSFDMPITICDRQGKRPSVTA
jgi:ABC-type Fe3+ transport system permease subunit